MFTPIILYVNNAGEVLERKCLQSKAAVLDIKIWQHMFLYKIYVRNAHVCVNGKRYTLSDAAIIYFVP